MAVQCSLGQNVVVGSMLVLQVALGNVPRGVWLDPRLLYNCTVPRFGVELPARTMAISTLAFLPSVVQVSHLLCPPSIPVSLRPSSPRKYLASTPYIHTTNALSPYCQW